MGGGQSPRRRRARDPALERVFRRRRRAALAVLGVLLVLVVWGIASIAGGDESQSAKATPPELPRGGRAILPRYRVVTYYGAPQDPELGVLGTVTPRVAAARLVRQARAYERKRRPVLPAFELLATIAHAAPGDDGLHRLRQDPAVISRYLRAVRRIKGLLILDVQPGQADFLDEARALEPYLLEPDVELALDSEWSVPGGTVPGEAIGSTDAETINRVSAYVAALVRSRRLPQKLLLVHQFTEGMVKDRQAVVPRPGLAIVFNVDGFGTQELKTGVYERLTDAPAPARPLFGLKLFFSEDTGLMTPHSVFSLRPRPAVVVYE
jgi:hypothetical protein